MIFDHHHPHVEALRAAWQSAEEHMRNVDLAVKRRVAAGDPAAHELASELLARIERFTADMDALAKARSPKGEPAHPEAP